MSYAALKFANKVAPIVSVMLFAGSAILAFYALPIAWCLLSISMIFVMLYLVARAGISRRDLRTTIRQELREVNFNVQPTSACTIDQKVHEQVEALLADKANDDVFIVRELHAKTVEEVRFLQAQLQMYFNRTENKLQ